MARSMTGFARREGQFAWGQLICEIRSVNHRYLEPSLRLSESLRSMEPGLREVLRKRIGRGKVELILAIKLEESAALISDYHQETAEAVIRMVESINAKLKNPAPVNGLDILTWPGVLQAREVDQQTLEQEAEQLFQETLSAMLANRAREGEELAQLITQRLTSITEQIAVMRTHLPQLQRQQEEKLRTRLAALTAEIEEDRLAQELVYLAQKSDVTEELDRLEAHLNEVRHTLEQKEPVGRRLDFLMQELNREANTLGSKSTSSTTTQAAVDIKVLIEQMREQIQNIE